MDFDETYNTRKHFSRSIFLTSQNHPKTQISKKNQQSADHEKNTKNANKCRKNLIQNTQNKTRT